MCYLAAVAPFPLFWSYTNYTGTGHFFFTKNADMTLQNFAARHFIEDDTNDPELVALQKHASSELACAQAEGLKHYETYAFSRSFDKVGAELGNDDRMYL